MFKSEWKRSTWNISDRSLRGAYEQHSLARGRYWDGALPVPAILCPDQDGVLLAQPENQFCGRSQKPMRPLDQFFVEAYGTSRNEIETLGLLDIVHAGSQHSGISEIEPPDSLRKKRSFFMICLDENNLQAGNCHRDGNSRKTGSRPNVGEPTILDRNTPYGKETFSKMELDDLFLFDHRGK